MSAVPKGLLRYWVLELLRQRPRSGSEIVREIAEQTNGCWIPRPGSIYPLLSALTREGLAEISEAEGGMKRYILTSKGRQFLKELRELKKQFEDKKRLLMPLFFTILSELPENEARKIREAVHRLFCSLIDARRRLEADFSKRAADRMVQILEETSKKLEKLAEHVEG